MALHDDLREGTVNLERLVASKKPHLLRWVPRWVMAYLRRILHLESVNRTIQEHPGLMGVAFADVVLAEMEVTYRVEGLQRLSPEGRYLVVSNHPLGGLDGMVLISAFGHAFEQIYFPVNDFLTLLPQFADIFLPINKHGAQSVEAARRLQAAYASEAQILYFPAGLCSRKRRGRVQDLAWKGNFVAKAVEYQRDVVPVYFDGRNSTFFYNLSRLRRALGIKANIEMIYLVDEMYRQHGANLSVVVGEPIPWQTFLGHEVSRTEWAARLRQQVYTLGAEWRRQANC